MNIGDVYMAKTDTQNESGIRPVIIIDKRHVNILTTLNKRNFASCVVNGVKSYIVPDKIRIRDIMLFNYIATINI